MKWNHLLAIGLIALAFMKMKGGGGTDIPDVPIPAPSADLQREVESLKQFRGKKHADVVATFYSDFADVIGKDSSIKTKGQFRNVHVRAQALFAEKTDLAGSLPGLSEKIDVVISNRLGKEDGNVDKAVLHDTLQAIAWGLGGK